MHHVLLCGNPSARSGNAAASIAQARLVLEGAGAKVELLATAPEGKTPALVRDRVNEGAADIVVALGGDGTFADVGKGLLLADRACPLGLIPFGTANDQAKSFGIPCGDGASHAHVPACVRIIFADHITMLDAGEVQRIEGGKVTAEEVFFDSVGFGFQAEVLRKRNVDRDKVQDVPLLRDLYRDQAVYAGALLDTYLGSFARDEKMDVELTIDGARVSLDHVLDVIVKNTAIYGGEWVLARAGRPDDGKMEIVPFSSRRDLFKKAIADLALLPDLERGLSLVGAEPQRPLSGANIELRFIRGGRPRVQAQLDGEQWIDGAHFRVHVIPHALRVLTPAEFTAPWAR